MSTTDHNKILGVLHLGYGAFNVLVMTMVSLFMFGVLGFAAARSSGGEAAGMGLFAVIMLFVIGLNLLFTVPEFVAGYALLKRKKWAKIAGTIAAILESLSFPFGTALCVYTLWFLFSEQGRVIYDQSRGALPPPPPRWAGVAAQREVEYVPPASPPDWR